MKDLKDLKAGRKEYQAPTILHTEKIEARAVVCTKSDSETCGTGTIQS
jgi:hypothetical protein